MSEILVVAEHRRGELAPATLEAIAAAVELKQAGDMTVTVAVLALDPSVYTEQVSVAGVDAVVNATVAVSEFQNDIYEAVIDGIIEARRPAVVLLPHSIDAWGYAPALAARRECGFATDVFGLRFDGGDLVATRAAYSEKLHVELDFPGKETVLITLRGNVYKPVEGASTPAVTSFQTPAVEARTEHKGFIEPESTGDVDITQAELMLSVGRGVAEEDNIEQFSELADAMGFTLGCSRPIADSGWLPKSRQVGQSGKTVSNCNTYLALGISGSVQHMAGMKHVANIIAVNTDAEASIFTIARYGVVADMFDIAEELKNHFV
jgi:electron transfer flavoprotein alpha subunit